MDNTSSAFYSYHRFHRLHRFIAIEIQTVKNLCNLWCFIIHGIMAHPLQHTIVKNAMWPGIGNIIKS